MSEEVPMRDRSHIEKTLMLNEDKPVDDYSGNQRKDLDLGLGSYITSGQAEPQGLGSEASGYPGLRALDMGGLHGRCSESSIQGWGGGCGLAGRRKGDPHRGATARVGDRSQCCHLVPCASLHAVAGEACDFYSF